MKNNPCVICEDLERKCRYYNAMWQKTKTIPSLKDEAEIYWTVWARYMDRVSWHFRFCYRRTQWYV